MIIEPSARKHGIDDEDMRDKTRAERLKEYERWADRVQPGELRVLGRSQEIVDQLDESPQAESDPPALAAGV